MKQILTALVLSLTVSIASAHSPVSATAPVDGAILKQVPSEISLTFKRNFRLTKVTLTHADKHSDDLDLSQHSKFSTQFSLPIEGMGAGAYVIEWRGLGDDGHPQNGTFEFTVE